MMSAWDLIADLKFIPVEALLKELAANGVVSAPLF
jgi:hypothetical protein